MAEHAIICKFMGIWPTERALCLWIRQQWKPRGDVKLHLGAKGFFTVVFSNLEDKDRIFEGDPYFLDSAGLYMWPRKPNFVPENESFTHVPVWIRLFSLPIDYWGCMPWNKLETSLEHLLEHQKRLFKSDTPPTQEYVLKWTFLELCMRGCGSNIGMRVTFRP